jgi:D-sedoheptulose 7-phosphate isomerase
LNTANNIIRILKDNIALHQAVLEDENILNQIQTISESIISSIKEGNLVMICGNGGSAADAQHMAAELVGRFEKERKGLPAIDLTANAPIITSLANDYDFNKVFSRQVESFGKTGDILIGFSTSGNSKNVAEAFRYARERGIVTIGMLGRQGGILKDLSDIPLIVPHEITARIQEVHATIIHIVCGIVELYFAENSNEK